MGNCRSNYRKWDKEEKENGEYLKTVKERNKKHSARSRGSIKDKRN